MSSKNKIGRRVRGVAALAAVGGAVAAAVVVTSAGSSSAAGDAVGQPPPEWAANAGSWPAHNYDISNTRATTQSAINSQNVSQLKVKWSFPLKGTSLFGDFATTPIVLNGVVYMQDLNSNVYAVDRSTGKLKWEHKFNQVSQGPNGLAYGYGRLYGVTFASAFALDPATGKQLWSRKLTRNTHEAIDIAPQLYDNTVLVSTIPNEAKVGEGDGILWALDAATGKRKWGFNTVKGGAKLYGNAKLNGGGGVWYPPAVDNQGRVFATIANPTPFPGSKPFPNASSRPGPNLYTNSLVALDGKTGKLLWFRQTVPHDVRDYDFEDSPIVTTIPIGGVQTQVVLAAGKAGWVYAYRARDGKQLWKLSVGKHQNDRGPLPKSPVTVFPGLFGGVETPMALADNRLFVPWDDLASRLGATGFGGNPLAFGFKSGRGGLTAVDSATGKVLWQRKLPSLAVGAATVANDVVFTSTYAGTTYALDTRTGRTLWTAKAPAGINSFPAIDGDTLIVGAGTTGFLKNPKFQVIAYSLQ
jgi:outer membrane protein assembly factor BamB